MRRVSRKPVLLLAVPVVQALCAAPAGAQTVLYTPAPTVTYYAPAPAVVVPPVSSSVTTYRYGYGILPRRRLTVANYSSGYYAPPVTSYYAAPAPVTSYYAAPVTSYYAAPAPVVVQRQVTTVRYYTPAYICP